MRGRNYGRMLASEASKYAQTHAAMPLPAFPNCSQAARRPHRPRKWHIGNPFASGDASIRQNDVHAAIGMHLSPLAGMNSA